MVSLKPADPSEIHINLTLLLGRDPSDMVMRFVALQNLINSLF
jgi:hypothetical protein